MTSRLRLAVLFAIIGLTAILIAGCGGGKGGDPPYAGSATLTIVWPARTIKAIAPESVRIVITSGSQTIAERTVNRPATGSATLANFEGLPSGTYRATVTAYPLANAGGSPISQASSELLIQTGSDTKLSFATNATVDRVVVTAPSTSVVVNSSITLIATALTAEGVAVLLPEGSITWSSANDSMASVDSAGTVTGHAAGTVDITATEGGSGQSGSIEITVPPTTWTVMVYMAADNNLESYGISDMNEMEMVGSNSNVNVVVQMDRSVEYNTSNGNWSGARRYLVTKDSDGAIINSTMIQDLGNTNMASAQTLTSFIQWATSTYPAEHYLLVVWDHGRGWRSGTAAIDLQKMPQKSVCADDSYGDEMSLAELAQALSSAHRTDVVFFDACLMGMLEVAHALRNTADVMVASEDDVPATGEPYDQMLNQLTANPHMSAQMLGQVITDEYVSSYTGYGGEITMAAVDLHSVDQLTSAADQFSDAVLANMDQVRSGVRSAQEATQYFDSAGGYYTYYRDLYDFARLVNNGVTNTAVKTAAQNLMSSVNSTIIHEGHNGGVPNAHGISVYLPGSGQMSGQYPGTTFAQSTSWNEMLSAY